MAAHKASHYTRAQVCRILDLTQGELRTVLNHSPDMLVEIEGTPMIPAGRVKDVTRIRKRLGLPTSKEK